jgi:GntR family transcriptional regulator/MocR family aminotransferase
VVAVEDPGYAFSWPAFRTAGARLVPVPVDHDGMVIEHLRSIVDRHRVKAILVTPHAQYPTGVSLSVPRRIALLAMARAHRFAIIEDDFVHELRFDGPPRLPLASADTAGSVIYLGSFSKTFAPSLRLGFVVAPEPLVDRLARLRARIDVCGDSVTELAMAELIEDGELERHHRRIMRILRRRSEALMEELERKLGSVIRFERATGGSALWITVDPAIDVEDWSIRALREGVGFLTGRHFFFDGKPRPHLWLSFGALDECKLAAAVSRMAAALPRRSACPS